MPLQNNAVDLLLDQVIASITEEDIEKIFKREAVCPPGQGGPGGSCPNPIPIPPRPPLRMIAYDDMVNDTNN
ncbi:hypothetical protein [Acinetobacter genomosp. 15BJ]|uniref:Uncharacterized protein n=1 Tax=Acinetobacter genomosp. 15BJ TaxID=106651 RepID=R9B7F6_9GAMM|nr:hypothetical protein [Acinetobacter genomosp. 15BJ]EOR10388.1 hypothetical protein F896_00516 [Acinetobacter genomosp. 15BJ]MCH7292716.1 hypothetical protein [Acinetobacter genomosp. 15BJ]MDO3656814.1 hypothetical protein [Acinetobacter genomosp. 15BJ]